MKKDIEVTLKKILKTMDDITISVENIGINDELEHIGMDSITLIALIGAIEEQFNFEFDDEDLNMEKFKSIKKIIKYVEEKTL